jgi:hypothetical protein
MLHVRNSDVVYGDLPGRALKCLFFNCAKKHKGYALITPPHPKMTAVVTRVFMISCELYCGISMEKKHVWAKGNESSPALLRSIRSRSVQRYAGESLGGKQQK